MSHSASHHERKRVEKREVFFEKSDPTTWFLEVFTPHGFFVIVQELPSPKLIVFLEPKKTGGVLLGLDSL